MAEKKDKLSVDIGRRISNRRKQLGLTQEQAAEKAGLTQQFFASVETGTKNMRAESIVKVSKALNMSTDFLLMGQVTDIDVNNVMSMLRALPEQQFWEIENIIKEVLIFGGYETDI